MHGLERCSKEKAEEGMTLQPFPENSEKSNGQKEAVEEGQLTQKEKTERFYV